MASTVASAVRPGLRDFRNPSSPHTPSRFISSTFSSPGSTFRQEEDAIIIELGARYLRAGFEGETGPQCVLTVGPEHDARIGDYRRHSPGFWPRAEDDETWACQYELWSNDLRDLDLELVEDRLERYIRMIYNNWLLTNAGDVRLLLVLPSLFPMPLLSSVLSLLFERWAFPSITLLPSPTMAAVGAGVRSALVVDIGWEETVITPVYEYRELSAFRTIKAMKTLTRRVAEFLKKLRHKKEYLLPVNFEFVEEVLQRCAVCFRSTSEPSGNAIVEIDWPTKDSFEVVEMSSKDISDLIKSTLLDVSSSRHEVDDNEKSIPFLLHKALATLPNDVRTTCMARVIFVGGGSNVSGLTDHILQDVHNFLREYGWDLVRGEKITASRNGLTELAQVRATPPDARHAVPLVQENDSIGRELQKTRDKETPRHVEGQLRQIESLGAWAGASLVTSLRIKGLVEIDRERFLSHGLAGASREAESNPQAQRTANTRGQEPRWTLAGWG